MHTRKHSVLSRLLATLLAVVMMIGIVGYVPEARAETKEIAEVDFLEAANSKIGAATTQGMCLGWVRSFWVGLGAQSSTSCCAHNYSLGSGRIVSTSKDNIPIGANIYFRGGTAKCIYSNGGGCGRICGHIGIHIGNGKVISSRKLKNQSSCVGVETIAKWESWGYTYAGWGWHTGVKVVSDYSTVDSISRTGISIKPASGEDQCYIKEKPFEDSNNKAASVPEGNTIKIVGAVKNKYGNIWYKTEDGGFVYSGDIIFFRDYFSISAKFKNTEKRSSRKYPFEDSDAVKKIGKDDVVQVSKFVLNSYGNIWAQLTDGSYLCFYDKNSGENKMKFSAHVTQPTHSTTYPQGNIKVTSNYGFLFKGDVKADVPFLSLTARVIDRETEQDVAVTGSPCTLKPGASLRTINLEKTKIDGKTMDNIVLIRKLNGSSGWYRYELNAQFGFTYEGKTFKFGNEYNFVSSNFSVGKAGETEPNFSTDPFDQFSSLFTLSAKFKNTEKRSSHEAPYLDSPKVKTIGKGDIVEVTEFVTNSHGNIWAKLTDGSYLCFYDQETGENKMKFSAHVTEPSISGETKPTGNINVTDQGFWLKGTVSADVPFLTVSTRIIDREADKDVEGRSPVTEKGNNKKSISISRKNDDNDLDSRTIFNNLPKGWYQYQLNAQFGFTYSGQEFRFGDSYNFITSNFTVGNPGELETEPAPTPSPSDEEEDPAFGDESVRVPGDVNENGSFDPLDAVRMLKWLAGWDVTINESNADVNGNGAADPLDAVRMLKYLAGWDVVLQ